MSHESVTIRVYLIVIIANTDEQDLKLVTISNLIIVEN